MMRPTQAERSRARSTGLINNDTERELAKTSSHFHSSRGSRVARNDEMRSTCNALHAQPKSQKITPCVLNLHSSKWRRRGLLLSSSTKPRETRTEVTICGSALKIVQSRPTRTYQRNDFCIKGQLSGLFALKASPSTEKIMAANISEAKRLSISNFARFANETSIDQWHKDVNGCNARQKMEVR